MADRELGEWVKQNTNPNAIFLTDPECDPDHIRVVCNHTNSIIIVMMKWDEIVINGLKIITRTNSLWDGAH